MKFKNYFKLTLNSSHFFAVICKAGHDKEALYHLQISAVADDTVQRSSQFNSG